MTVAITKRRRRVRTLFSAPRPTVQFFTDEMALGSAQLTRFAANLEEPHPSRILLHRSKPSHRLGELYDDMLEKDTELSGLVDKRRKAVLSLPRMIIPADNSPKALEIADFCRMILGTATPNPKPGIIPNININFAHQFNARTHGVAFDELMWEKITRGPLTGKWVPVDMIDRPMWRFFFQDRQLFVRHNAITLTLSNNLLIQRSRIFGGTQPFGIPVPPAKMLCNRFGTKDSSWGKALLDGLYWYYHIKQNAWKYFAIFLERFGQPTVVGKYDQRDEILNPEAKAANEADILALQEAIDLIQTEYGVVIPQGLAIDFMEAKRDGQASYENFILMINRAYSVAIMGEVDTSGLGKGPGSFAKSKVSQEVRKETTTLDATDETNHWTRNFVHPLVWINYGIDAPLPTLLFDSQDVEDRRLRQAGIEAILVKGLPVGEDHLYSTYLVPRPRPGEETFQLPIVAERES